LEASWTCAWRSGCVTTSRAHTLLRRPDFGTLQFEKGLGATAQDDVEAYYKDPRLSKGKRPGEMDAGSLVCAALQRMGVTTAKTTWATLDRRLGQLIDESTSWFNAFGSADKMPTGRAKTTRVVFNAETGKDETENWEFKPWMWTFMRLGKQRAGKMQEERVKKEERAERVVAQLKAQLLTAPVVEKDAVRAKIEVAQERLVVLSGGRRGKKAKRRRPKTEDGSEGVQDSDDDDTSGKGARKGNSVADTGLGAVLQAAKETGALMKESLASMTTMSKEDREFQAAEREKDRAHALQMHQAALAAQHTMMMEMMKTITRSKES